MKIMHLTLSKPDLRPMTLVVPDGLVIQPRAHGSLVIVDAHRSYEVSDHYAELVARLEGKDEP